MFQVCGLRTFATEEDAEAREVGLQHNLLVPTGFYITMHHHRFDIATHHQRSLAANLFHFHSAHSVAPVDVDQCNINNYLNLSHTCFFTLSQDKFVTI